MSRTAAHDGTTSRGRIRRWGAILAAGALLATGLAMVPGTASANGDCVFYWSSGGDWSGAPAAGGTGTAEDPYRVGSRLDLEEVRYCGAAHFVQIADIDLSSGLWAPLRTTFTGVYEGAGHTISGMRVERPSDYLAGLFRVIAGSGKVTDLALDGVDVTGQANVGAVAGTLLESGEISKVTVNGSVTGTALVGGIVGNTTATPPGSETSAAVAGPVITDVASSTTVTGQDAVGGIVGEASDSTISKAAASGTISGGSYVGGIIGRANSSTLTELASDVTVTASLQSGGGIAGWVRGTSPVSDSAAAGTVQADSAAGGLIGQLSGSATVTDTASDVAVSGQFGLGGLVGRASDYPTITRSVAAGAVTGGRDAGGLLGSLTSGAITITDSSASGAVSGTNQIGGLVGIMIGSVKRSSASGAVTASGDDAGGLLGALIPAEYDICGSAVCAATPPPDVPTEIRASYATGTVQAYTRAGGLVGLMSDGVLCPTSQEVQLCSTVAAAPSATIFDSYSTGAVSATGVAGGLIGSTGALQTDSVEDVGVQVEPVSLTVTNTYNSGVVSAATRSGVLGEDPGNATVIESFWDATANPGLTGAKGLGKTQAQLRDITTFTKAQWLIQAGAPATGNNVWGICVPPDAAVHNGYPFLLWQHTSINPCHPVPQAPVLKSLTPGDRTLGVTAELRADGDNPVTKVQYRLDGGEWKDSGGATGSFTITGLTNGTTYKVQVRAVNTIGASEASNELSGTPTGGTPTATVLKVNGLDKGERLPVDQRSVLVRSVRTNGQVVVARVFCTLKGNRLPPRLRDRLCSPTVTGPAATAAGDVTAAAKTRKKKLRVTATPACSAGLRVHVTIAAKAKSASRKVFTRSYRVDNKPPVKCRIKGTG